MKTKSFILILSLFSVFNSFSEEYILTVVFSESSNSKNREFFDRAVQTNGFYLKEQFIPITLSQPKVKLPRMAYVYDIRVESDNINEFVQELKETEQFEYVLLHEPASTCCVNPHPPLNDAKIVDGTYDCYHLDLINARCAWSITKGNPTIVIGIADSDFELTHEDLKNQIVQISGPISAGHPHGTRVSGSAAAETNNGKGIAGIGYNSKIAAYRIDHYIDSDGGASTTNSSNIKNAVWDAYLDGRRIINVSWTSTGLTPVEAQAITENGTTLVVAAGNTSISMCHSSIANIPGVINVSNVDSNNNYATNRARNQYVDLCAPGEAIAVTWHGNSYGLAWGTSHAAPMVAGTVALMLSVNPNLTPAEIETILKNTAAPINNAHLYPGLIGAGRLDAYAAVQAACATVPSPVNFINQPPVTSYKTIISCGDINIQNVTVTNNATLTLNAVGNINVQNVNVQNNAKLILDAASEVNIICDFDVELGSEFEII